MASLARRFSYLSNLSRLYDGTTSGAFAAIKHAEQRDPQRFEVPSTFSYSASGTTDGQSISLRHRGTPRRLPTSLSGNPSSLANLPENDTLHTGDFRNRAPSSFSSGRGHTSDYLSGTPASSSPISLISDQSQDGTSALSLLVDAKRAKQTAKDLAVLQKCLERMAVGGPTNDADLAQTLLELAQKPHMCELIPGLNQFRRPLDAKFDAAVGGQRKSDVGGRLSAMNATRLGRLHLPKRENHKLSSLSSAGLDVPTTASGAHSPTKPTSPTSPVQSAKQQHYNSDPGYGENLPGDEDDENDGDDDNKDD